MGIVDGVARAVQRENCIGDGVCCWPVERHLPKEPARSRKHSLDSPPASV
jgi:hypothetical protein